MKFYYSPLIGLFRSSISKIFKNAFESYLAGWGFKGKSVTHVGTIGLQPDGSPFSRSKRLSPVVVKGTMLLFFTALGFIAQAQNSMGVGTETPNPNAVLQLVSPTGAQGFLVPTYSTAQRTAATFTSNLSATDNGLLVFDSDEGLFYFWMDTNWEPVGSASGDMLLSVFDTDLNNYVDTADVANTLNGFTVETSVPVGALFTDDQTAAEVVVTPTGNLAATDVQSALVELQTDIDAAGGGDMLQTAYDTDANNIVDDAELVNGLTVQTAVPVGAVFTDNQTATDVVVTPAGNLTSVDVQAALLELQADIDAGSAGGDMLQSAYDTDANSIVDRAESADSLSTSFVDGVTIAYSVGASALEVRDNGISNAKISDVDWSKLTNVPVGISDGDNQTAVEVPVTPSGNLTSSDVQASLVELQGEIDTNVTGISTNASDISSINTSVSSNSTAISTNQSDIASNATAISTNTTDISTLNTSVSSNSTAISTNQSDIASNATAISTNTTDISTLNTSVSSNSTAISTNQSDIASNAAAISTNTTDIATINTSLSGALQASNNLSELTPTAATARGNLGLGTLATQSAVGTTELIDDAVTAVKINTDVAGAGLTQNVSGALDVDVPSLAGSGIINNAGQFQARVDNITLGINGSSEIEVAPLGITGSQIATDAIGTDKILDGSIVDGDLDKANIPLSGFGPAQGDLVFADGAARTLQVNQKSTAVSGDNLIISAGAAGTGSALSGGNLFLQAGAGDGVASAGFITMTGDRVNAPEMFVTGSTSGTSGTVFAAYDNLATRLAVLTSNGNFSLGSSLGSSQLEVVNNGAATHPTGIFTVFNNAKSVYHLTVANTGFVGIGTNAPGTALDVNGTATATAFVGDGSSLTNVNASSVAASAITTTEILDGTIAGGDLDKANIALSGFGAALADVSLGGNKITNLATPTLTSDAANKNYVDTQVGGIVSSQWVTSGSDIYYNTGLVGINNNSPVEALDVIGNVRVTGDVVYATAKPKLYAISPVDFIVLKQFGNEDYSATYNGGIEVGAYSAAAGTDVTIAAPVHLPDGAVITQIDFMGRNTGTNPANFNLVAKSYSTASTPTLINNIPAGASGVTTYNATGLSITINNNLNNYFVTFQAWTSQATLTGVKIYYQVSSPD